MKKEISLLVRCDDEFNELLSRFSQEDQSSIFESALIMAGNAELNFSIEGGEQNNNILEINDRISNTENMIRTMNERLLGSSTKGQVGEMGLNEVLTTFLKGYSITNTEKTAHSGDFIIERNGHKIMIDSKLYRKTVSKAEIDKLVRDMEEKNIFSGILISPTASIANKSPPIDTEKREDGKYIVYVSNCSVDCVVGAIKLCELYDSIEKTPDLWNPDISFERIEKSLEKLKNTHSLLSDVSTSLGRLSIEMNSVKEKCEQGRKEFLSDMMEISNSLHEEFNHIREDLPYFNVDEVEKYVNENAIKSTFSAIMDVISILSEREIKFHTGNKCIELYKNGDRVGKIKLTTKDSELDLGDLKLKLGPQGGRGNSIETVLSLYIPSS